ncbi:MAG: polysaccharide ABC transporter ATP-binding protein [Candidatus Paceibacterota bacterium]|jgi:lipopolysaccharide transport system ATP-binding protein
MKPIIEVKNIGKKYMIAHGRGSYVSLRDVATNIFKRPLSFLKNKAKKAIGLEKREDFWALKDINFTVEKGDVIGIIGNNGAGKSTLLKILSQITTPTEGEIIIRGKVGSLLEVGTGFHPELTGRENIFLNGAILGMKKTEIVSKFDQIVEFAGIEKFLDTPVKYYSSGMYVRLAFSVAAHMEPDILIVDEVLAVGDIEFQKKCLGKMNEITKKEGRTILFVSHNLGAIGELCNKGILLHQGHITHAGPIEEVIKSYTKVSIGQSSAELPPHENYAATIRKIFLTDNNGLDKSIFDITDDVNISIEYDVNLSSSQLQLALYLRKDAMEIVRMFDTDEQEELGVTEPGRYRANCKIPAMFIKAGSYTLGVDIGLPHKLIQNTGPVIGLEVKEMTTNTQNKSYRMDRSGLVVSPAKWKTEKIS